jgi:proline dehydrogenase
LQYLKDSIKVATEEGYLLGAKLVRGAYMDKERARAQELGYPSPIQPNKAATDKDFDAAVAICLANFPLVSICLASHNEKSCMLLADEIQKRPYLKDRPEILICQLYGMSDNLTFNFAKAGYRAAKYLPYGTIDDVIPYLIRRANENSSVSGDMSRELGLITREMKRRKLL